jgi:hypothetical protein
MIHGEHCFWCWILGKKYTGEVDSLNYAFLSGGGWMEEGYVECTHWPWSLGLCDMDG